MEVPAGICVLVAVTLGTKKAAAEVEASVDVNECDAGSTSVGSTASVAAVSAIAVARSEPEGKLSPQISSIIRANRLTKNTNDLRSIEGKAEFFKWRLLIFF
jgi:hypothetical protein